MKKIYMLGTLLMAAVGVSAESVSSVSFNPSRLGGYEHLKVSGNATLRGGLKTKDLNVVSKPTPQFSQTDGSGTSATGTGGTISLFYPNTLPSGTTMFTLDKVTGVSDQPYINMPSAIFHKKGTDNVTNFSVTGLSVLPAANTRTNMLVSGGFLTFNGGSGDDTSDSFIETLQADNNLLQYANKANVGTLSVSGSPDSGVPLMGSSAGADGGSTQLIQIGGVDIPYPNASSVQHRRAGSSSTYAATFTDFSDPSMSGCQLRWIARPVTPQTQYSPTAANRVVRVLGLSGNCPLACIPSDPISDYEYKACPSGQYGQQKRLFYRQTVCTSGHEEEQITYPSDAWDTSGCKNNPQWTYVEGSMERNTYESHWVITDTGYWRQMWVPFHWVNLYHVDGLNNTRCATNGGNPRLWFGDTIMLLSDYMDFLTHIAATVATITVPSVWDDLWDTEFQTQVIFHRLLKNWVGGDHSHKVRTGDRIDAAPSCTTSRIGQEVWEEIYYVQPKITVAWPMTCKGWGYRVKYRCQ